MQSTSPSRVHDVVAAYQQLIRLLGNARSPEFLEVNITMPQMKVLMLLAATGAMRVSDMAAQLGVSLPTITGLVDRLVDAGYADRRDDQTDRRQVLVSATPAALAFIDRFQDLNGRLLGELLTRVDADELDVISRAIQILTAAAADGPLGQARTAERVS
jgi:DNA-binding MarR family transcriptional regulator